MSNAKAMSLKAKIRNIAKSKKYSGAGYFYKTICLNGF